VTTKIVFASLRQKFGHLALGVINVAAVLERGPIQSRCACLQLGQAEVRPRFGRLYLPSVRRCRSALNLVGQLAAQVVLASVRSVTLTDDVSGIAPPPFRQCQNGQHYSLPVLTKTAQTD